MAALNPIQDFEEARMYLSHAREGNLFLFWDCFLFRLLRQHTWQMFA